MAETIAYVLFHPAEIEFSAVRDKKGTILRKRQAEVALRLDLMSQLVTSNDAELLGKRADGCRPVCEFPTYPITLG